jgi:uncharacterized protein (DUF2141 family)
MRLKFRIRLLILALALFSINCAKRGFPPGGPEDLTPPQVLEVYPANNSLQVDPSIDIYISFSERMDRTSAERSIFITPLSDVPFEFKWNRNKLVLRSPQPLEKDKTYVITVGTNAQDLHNNKLEKSYSFAFSTGEELDSGFISGRVFFQPKKDKGISVWGYPLSKIKEPDPKKDKPEYVTLSGDDGTYMLSYLSKGTYRLFAVKDINADLIWNPDNEPLGITTRDLCLSPDSLSFANIDFNLVLRDTTPPVVLDCQSLDKNKVRLEFSEPLLHSRSLYEKGNYKIFSDSLQEESLKVEFVYAREGDSKKIYLVVEDLTKKKYNVFLQNLYDSSGNPIGQGYNECSFEGTELEDKSPLKIVSTYPQPKAVNVSPDAGIKLFFDKPPEKSSVEKGFVLEDSSGQKIKGGFKWEDPAALFFIPEGLLQGRMKYVVSLKGAVDLRGNPLADTSFKIEFSTLDPDTSGTLSGKVENLTREESEIVIILEKAEIPKLNYEKRLKEPGDFKFDNVFPGKYSLKAYLDLNGNGTMDFGNPLPFKPAEPQVIYPDTLNIRPRWETEGVILKFR